MELPLAGAILAGGLSRRLGRDKALVRFGGRTLLDATVATLLPLCQELVIVSNSPLAHAHPAARLVGDLFPGKGSLGGIYSGLSVVTCDRCLVVACDMPFLNAGLLAYMATLAADADVVIPRHGDHVEPMHAIYAKACLPHMKALLDANNLKIIDFFPHVRVRYVEGEEISRRDPSLRSFMNINTPGDLERALLFEAGGS
jgi:molybdopterin-guanine dinucleotide biosynthesis protein A